MKAFSGGTFSRDFTASIVVFLVAMPLCMGIAIASGVPPEKGLITGIIGGCLGFTIIPLTVEIEIEIDGSALNVSINRLS